MSEIEYRLSRIVCKGAGGWEGKITPEKVGHAHESLAIAQSIGLIEYSPEPWDPLKTPEDVEEATRILKEFYGPKARDVGNIPLSAAHGRYKFNRIVRVENPTKSEREQAIIMLEERFGEMDEDNMGPFPVPK